MLLKFRAPDGWGYIANVYEATTGRSWRVPKDQCRYAGRSQTETSFGVGLNVVDHGVPHPAESEPDRHPVAMEVSILREHPGTPDRRVWEIHIVDATACWLLNDGGDTIDSLHSGSDSPDAYSVDRHGVAEPAPVG